MKEGIIMAAQTTKIKSSYREPIILIAIVIMRASIG